MSDEKKENTPQQEEKLKFKFTVPERKRALERLQKFKYILDDPDYLKLKEVKRHGSTDTYKHSVRVAMIAAAMAERMGEDPDSAMKAGLLHDYCHLDYNLKGEEKKKAKAEANAGLYCYYHPKNAAENAQRFNLTERELDAIRTHMFPLGPMPKSTLGWIIRMADMEAGTEESFLAPRNKAEEKKKTDGNAAAQEKTDSNAASQEQTDSNAASQEKTDSDAASEKKD